MPLPAVRLSEKQKLKQEALALAAASKSAGTVYVYTHAWPDFLEFCADHSVESLPAQSATVAAYLTWLARGQQVSTIQVKLAAIQHFHALAYAPDPTAAPEVKAVMAGIRRTLGTAPDKKAPVTLTDLRAMVGALPATLAGTRDRALILVGWAGAFRRSELVALDVADIELSRRLVIHVRRSKTDPEGKGMVKVIPPLADKDVCPLVNLRRWLSAAEIASGPLFRAVDQWGHVRARRMSGKSVANIVKAAAARAGLDADLFAGHSLRSGFITEAAGAGVPSRDIMAQTGHKSETVMRGYIQDAGLGAMAAVEAAFRVRREKS